MRPDPDGQLDIFADSREVVLRNDLLLALEQDAPAASQSALVRLTAACPHDPALPSFDTLVRALESRSDAAMADHDALAQARRALNDDLLPAARRAMGTGPAADWIQRRQRDLAGRAAGLAFLAPRPDDHAAALWAGAGAWPEVGRAVEQIASWRRIPAPLGWALEARWRQGARDAAWPLLAELAWLAPARLDALLRRLDDDDPLLRRLLKQFGASFEGAAGDDIDDLSWFPAWLPIAEPALAPRLARAQPGQDTPPERGLRLVLELLGLERQGSHAELVRRRKSLRDLHASLYAIYMATR